ncbi:hypothetical protein CFC21_021220 [Triticum aestivum]|uniref:Uncharacterized protein n=3 Tax=Triticum TaxID=4564 RepID=A0A9R1PCX5_TRITD|nr:uncharacterized protein LOC123043366 [Triticum aestivum]KAF7006156.1 hypothetical protein CFC21_021220 [Triticum aestivum]VAH41079.1 unnamed protein product [Triticum turgidum subsp. durum]
MSVDLAHKIVSTLRRSERCKNTRVIYNDDYEEDSETEITDSEEDSKTQITDSEEVASPSPSELNVASVDDGSGEEDFFSVPRKDRRAPLKVKNKKAPKTISEGSGTKGQSQCGGLGVERSNEEVDLDEPLIALKQKKEKTTPSKAKRRTDASSSPHATKLDTSAKRDEISPVQTSLFESRLHDLVTQKLERRAVDQEHSRIAIERTCDHSSVVLHQFPIKDNECGQQPGFITQPTEADVSEAKAHLYDSVEQKKTNNNFSSLGPIDEVSNHQKSLDDTSNYTDVRCTSVVIQPDLCGSTDRICTSHEEVVQMPVEGQLDSLVCHGVKTKDILLHINVEQAATGYNFAFDKTLDLAHTANFDTQDGRLENIVYGALNNNVQRKCFETKTSVGVPDTVVTLSSPTTANVSHDGCLLLANMEGSSTDIDQLSGTMNVGICRSVNDQESRETGDAISDSSSNPEETQEISDGQTRASDFFIDEGSIEDHTPRKLLSQRKIMSPTSQEKFCNALAGIDLCGVQRLERKINLEDCDVSSQALPQTTNKQYRSILTRDRKLKSRTSISFTRKGVLKSTESPYPELTSSSVLLDTEKAVEFSQRQMHDIESIAANLIRSLKHMRSLVDENLSSEAQSLLPNFNTAEMRAASEDALKVERTTRKWLTIMNKDCNRFCKILTLEGKKAASHPELPRKRRRITFADEAGGMLCSVNVFSDVQTSPACEGES